MDLTLGVLLDGTIVSTALYGLTVGQTLRYFVTYADDKPVLKTVVSVAFLLETLHQFLVAHCLWFYLVRKGDGKSIADMDIWSWTGLLIPAQLVIFLVQCFYISRVWALQERKHASVLALLSAVEILGGIGLVVTNFMAPVVYDVNNYHSATLTAQNIFLFISGCSNFVTDLGIAFSMCRALYHNRSLSLEISRSVIDTLVAYAVGTGLLVTVFTIIFFVVSSTLPTTLVYMAFYLVGVKVYLNSMLASLNSRTSLRERLGDAVQEI